MKVFVILAAAAVLSGCEANFFSGDKPHLEPLTDAFWDYISKATKTADDTLEMIRKSQLGEEVNSCLANSADIAGKYVVTLQQQLQQLEPYTEDMKTQIQQRVEQLKQDLAPYADSLDSDALRTTLMQKSEELKTSLEQGVKDLRDQLGPYTHDLKHKVDRHLQVFQDSVVPVTQKVQVELTQRASLVKHIVAPYAEDLREKLDPFAEDLKDQLKSLYESFIKIH